MGAKVFCYVDLYFDSFALQFCLFPYSKVKVKFDEGIPILFNFILPFCYDYCAFLSTEVAMVVDQGMPNRIHKAFCGFILMMHQASKCKAQNFCHFIFLILILCYSGPTTVLACSLMFIGMVVMLHILGKFSS